MDILGHFLRYVEDNKLFSNSDKILVAVSGGRDSMLLLWLLIKSNYTIEIAHCNFQLRGEESDADEQLVRDFATLYNIPLHIKYFDTADYSKTNKVSIQMAARDLRYTWFEELREDLGCKAIAVAQHMNDSVETVLFNLSRGTGLLGLQGIWPKRGDSKVVRPLLFLQSKEITDFVQRHGIPYRDDASNFSNKYARNKIRLDIIPEFEKLNPDFITIMNDNIDRFRDSYEVLSSHMNDLRQSILIARDQHSWIIQKVEICKLSLNELYFLFEPFGFNKNVLQDLLSNLGNEPGRKFEAEHFTLITDRLTLVLSKKMKKSHQVQINSFENNIVWGGFWFSMEVSEDKSIITDRNIAKIDVQCLVFPLTIRSWVEGDVFQPLGMQGKKKLSDYFIQKKINILDKDKVPVLINGDGNIIWVVNYHLDDRFKIKDNTQKVLKLVCNLKGI